jgi:hypothetical protein
MRRRKFTFEINCPLAMELLPILEILKLGDSEHKIVKITKKKGPILGYYTKKSLRNS